MVLCTAIFSSRDFMYLHVIGVLKEFFICRAFDTILLFVTWTKADLYEDIFYCDGNLDRVEEDTCIKPFWDSFQQLTFSLPQYIN